MPSARYALEGECVSVYSLRSDNGIKRDVEGADPYTVNDNTHSKL